MDAVENTIKTCVSNTILELKTEIAKTIRLPAERQRLIYQGKLLQDQLKVSDYHMKDGQCLHLVAKINEQQSSQGPNRTQRANNARQARIDGQELGGAAEMP